MSSRFIQFQNNGWKLTNSLGWILRDRCHSVVEVRDITRCYSCFCPTKQQVCLQLPIDIDSANRLITIPFYDPSTSNVFSIKRGCLLDNIIIARNPNVCLDPNLQFILGTMVPEDPDEQNNNRRAQRWVSESNPVCGCVLNKCNFVKVDATNECTDVLVSPIQCPAELTPGQTVARGLKFQSGAGKRLANVTGPLIGETIGNCMDFCQEEDVACFKCGELEGANLAITVLEGTLPKNGISIAFECWELCCNELPCDQTCCPGAPNTFNNVGNNQFFMNRLQ